VNDTGAAVCEVEIDLGDGVVHEFQLRPVSPTVLEAPNVVAAGIAASLGKSYGWASGFFFGNLPLSLELWITIAGISGLDE